MSNAIVMASQAPFQHAYGLMSTFVEQCPDHLWVEKRGGWPLWQQVAHALACLCFFAGATPEDAPCAGEVLFLSTQGTQPVDKDAMRAFALKCKATADAYIAGLDDAALTQENVPVTEVLGASVSHAAALGMLASHTLYHLGSCDAALRDSGLPGVF